MGDYHRQDYDDNGDNDVTNTPTKGGWRRMLRSRSSTPQRRRSVSTGRSRRNYSPMTSNSSDYQPPTTPILATPLQSNAATAAAEVSTNGNDNNHNASSEISHIEMPILRSPPPRSPSSSARHKIHQSQQLASSLNDTMKIDNTQQQHKRGSSLDNIDILVNHIIDDEPNNSNSNNNNRSGTNNDIENPINTLLQSQPTMTTIGTIDTVGSNMTMSIDDTSISNHNLISSKNSRKPSRLSSRRSKSKSYKRASKGSSGFLEEKLDTYSGVFLPCLAQIVGVIFFLRLPTITGQAGTIGATLIIVCCVCTTFLTSLSLSAIASNGTIQAGGPYYIISRTLGFEIGGALGLLFYLGTTLGASMHVMGAVETIVHRKKHAYIQNNSMGMLITLVDSCPNQVWSLLLMFIIAQIVSVGSRYVNKAANFFLVTVGLSIFSILLGTILFAFGVYDGSLSDEERAFNDNLYPNYRPDPKTGVTPTFWGLVAIFYPATTGIMAGTNRSAKLATPNKSIPIGTIGAIAVTTLLYICQVWLIGSVVSNELLIYNKLVLSAVAYPSLIMAKIGMVTSCIGAALQCMAGAPQLLGAIAADDAIPFLKFLTKKKRTRKNRDPSQPPSPGRTRTVLDSGGSLLGLNGLGESTSLDGRGNGNGDDNASIESEKSADIEEQNSKRAVWFTWAIASLGTLLGNIDHITPILTMFYLMMYGGINLCCFLLAWVDSPGFRPQ